jgi:hypothetical protein
MTGLTTKNCLNARQTLPMTGVTAENAYLPDKLYK